MRGLRLPALLAAVLICGLGCSLRAQAPQPAASPMLDCSGLPCVDATVAGGKHFKMLVDTGNAHNLLDTARAKELGLELKPVNGPDGKPYPGYFLATVNDVKIGAVALGDLKILVVDLQAYMDKGQMPVTDIVLSYTAFKNRILKMDYKQRLVSVSDVQKTEAPCPGFCGTISNPTFGKQGPPIVVTTGFELNGKPLTMQVDTLYSGSMLIYPTSVEKLGLTAQQNTTKKRRFPFTDGGVDMIEGNAETQAFDNTVLQKNAPIYFATPGVHLPDGMFDGTVGQELFSGHVLTLDFMGQHFWIG